MTEKTESNGKKEAVKLRERLLEDGTKSLYLDIQHNGKRSREFLKLYLLEGLSSSEIIRIEPYWHYLGADGGFS